jgi:hypothetical protein
VLPQGLRDGLDSVASAKLDLSLFQVAANRLLAKPECFGNLAELRPSGKQPQD